MAIAITGPVGLLVAGMGVQAGSSSPALGLLVNHPLDSLGWRAERARYERGFPNLTENRFARNLAQPATCQHHGDSLEADCHRQRSPGVTNPQLIFIGNRLEPPVVADKRGGVAVSNRVDDVHHGCSKFRANGETVPIGVNAPVLAIPAYGYPRMLRMNVANHAVIVALPASFSRPVVSPAGSHSEACLGYVWLCALTGRRDRILGAALATLSVQGAALLIGRGNCPLGPLRQRLGDPTPLFELALPPRAAKAAVPVLVAVALGGVAIVALRSRASP